MLRPATRRSVLSLAVAVALTGCGSVDRTLFSGDGTFASLPDSDLMGSGPKGSLAKVDDPTVFLTSAAQISEQERNYESAAGHWAQLYASNPKNAKAALSLSENLRYIGRYEDAERVLRQTLREHPGNLELEAELAKTLIASGRLREGAATLTQLAERPGVPAKQVSRLRSAIGVAFDRAGKHGQAQASYALALRADPLNAIAMSNLGLSHALSGDLEMAEKKLREALIAPNASIQVRQNLAMVLALKGDTQAAQRLARQDLPPSSAENVVSYYSGMTDQTDAWTRAAKQ